MEHPGNYTLTDKLIVYDSNCKICSSLKDILVATLVGKEKVIAYKDLPPDLLPKIDPERFKNEMAMIDLKDSPTEYGAKGVAYILSTRSRLLRFLLRTGLIFSIFQFLYKVLAYNRYIIATPKSRFHCDCFPDNVVNYRVAYILICIVLAAAITALFGAVLGRQFGLVSINERVLQMILIAGSGWAVQILIAFVFMKDKWLEYTGHLGSIMLAGLLILIPYIVIESILGFKSLLLPIVSVGLSSIIMLIMHLNRTRHLQISQVWTLIWLVVLHGSAFSWIYFLYLNY